MALQSGDMVGPYRIIGQFGQGGMATVYKAYHPQLERNVAIKFLQQSYVDDVNFLTRFEREAKIIASLDHPNIVPVYDFNYYKGQPYLVMKSIEGVTLKEVMADDSTTASQILDMLVAVANGLTYAHERHVLHRDIKPSNILIDSTNRPYITDFGLARMTQASQSTLSQDMLMGTPHYMSPEQAKGSDDLGPATDIYSLGVILYEFAVGQVPFGGSTPYAIVHDHIYTALPQPRELNPNVSPAVEAVLIRALAKSPSDRYTSAVEMLSAFKNALSTNIDKPASLARAQTVAPIPSYSIGASLPVEPPNPAPARGRAGWLVGAGILALLLVLVLGAVILKNAVPPAIETPLPTLASLQVTVRSVPTVIPATDQNTQGDLKLDQAQTAVARNPNDSDTYIALAKAAWQQNETDVAQKAIEDGLAVTSDKISYLLSAASIAQDLNRINASIFLNTQALVLAQSSPTKYADVRALVGQALYKAAQTPDQINLREIDRLNKSILDFQQPDLFDIMSVQILVVQKRLPLAQASFNRLSDETSKLPEAYLVHGELLQAQGSSEKAKKEWKAVLQMPNTPQWVMDRVSELLNSN